MRLHHVLENARAGSFASGMVRLLFLDILGGNLRGKGVRVRSASEHKGTVTRGAKNRHKTVQSPAEKKGEQTREATEKAYV